MDHCWAGGPEWEGDGPSGQRGGGWRWQEELESGFGVHGAPGSPALSRAEHTWWALRPVGPGPLRRRPSAG